ncbi:putative Hit-like protein involved in cell-cycle regulation [Calothrix sp. NIES-4101]|nr:putative Hit-like protein involved in cell-cycle regulation [Calothrix sp. NIES-4101]
MNDSIFSKIIRGDAPGSFIYRDETVSVFLDVEGLNPGHCLVVPNQPATCLAELNPETGKHIFLIAHRIANLYRTGAVACVKCEGVNLWLSDGEVAGQEVFHVHLHVVPRFAGDSLTITYDAELWDESRRSQLDEIAFNIRQHL